MSQALFFPTRVFSDSKIIEGLAQVESIELLMMESFPVRIRVAIKGTLGDGCTTLSQITQERIKKTFKIILTTKRPADAICIQVLKTFRKSVALDVAGLEAGTYIVDVNRVKDTFTLNTNNDN